MFVDVVFDVVVIDDVDGFFGGFVGDLSMILVDGGVYEIELCVGSRGGRGM